MSKFVTYAHQAMAACGFAVLSPEVAATVRPDLFHSGMEASGSLGEANQHRHFHGMRGVTRLQAELAGLAHPTVTVITRSMDDLERRIQQVTGFKVLSIGPEPVAVPKAAPHPTTIAAENLAVARMAKLRALAAQELPSYGCTLRTEITRARQELARLGEADGVGFVPA